MNFPSLQSAMDYLKEKLQDFYAQRTVLTNRLAAMARLREEAIKRNDQETLGKLIVLRPQVVALLDEHFKLEDQLKPYAGYFGVQVWNLGVFPVVLAVAGVGMATVLYLYFEKMKNQAKALDLIARGMLSADQAEAILNPGFFSGIGGSFAQVGMLAVGGVFLFLFLTRR